MKSALEEIYYGNVGLAEKIIKSEEYEKVNNKYDKVYGQLLEGLNAEQKKMLDELYFLMGGLESETGLFYFKEGYKFCMRLVLESMSK